MMKKVNLFVFAMIACIMIAVLIIINTDSVYDSSCYNYEKFTSASADGKVISKYIDSQNHNSRIVQIENENGTYSKFDLTYHWNKELYDSLEVGYFIRKGKGETRVYYGEENLSNTIDISFNCGSTD